MTSIPGRQFMEEDIFEVFRHTSKMRKYVNVFWTHFAKLGGFIAFGSTRSRLIVSIPLHNKVSSIESLTRFMAVAYPYFTTHFELELRFINKESCLMVDSYIITI